ncbi:hypothetical protein SDC9_90494 [bioreactor metagenome]|uniref:Uncharacterized protein n=1 Tax=bioreactor metagenome TaxID=1076179 RepID=A0A644ZSU3_9ZZZZ
MKTKVILTGLFLGWVLQVYPQMMFEASGKRARVIVHKFTELDINSPETRWQTVTADEVGVLPQNRRFAPPVKKFDPAYTRIDINSNQNAIISVPGGYQIKISKYDLVDSRGNPVNGSYTLYFRDLTSPAAMALSGVKMNYDSGGVAGNFQSAGMFELYAEKDGEALKIRDGEKIDILLPTPNDESGFNLYSFDEKNDGWTYIEPLQSLPSNRPVPDSIPVYSDAYKFWSRWAFNSDSLSFDERWKHPDYARTHCMSKSVKTVNSSKDPYVSTRVLYFRMKRMTDKSNKRAVLFTLPVLSKSTIASNFSRVFPELNSFRNVVWKYIGPLDRSGFSKLYVIKKKYTDIRVEYDKGSGYFNITLKYIGGFVDFSAIPYRGKATDSDRAKLQNIQLNKRYTKALNKIRTNFDKKNKDFFLNLMAENRNLVQSKMSPEELAMTWEEWTEYAAKVSEYKSAMDRINQTINITRNISISGFGLVNCDKIDRMEEPVKILARFVMPDGNSIDEAIVMVIDAGDYSCLTLEAKNGSCSTVIEKRSPTAFAVAVNSKDLYVVNASDVASSVAGRSRSCRYQVHKVDGDATEAINTALQM